jgi:hypothetical protein
MEGQCFICSCPAYDFERDGNGFDVHIKHEHNMWNYLVGGGRGWTRRAQHMWNSDWPVPSLPHLHRHS